MVKPTVLATGLLRSKNEPMADVYGNPMRPTPNFPQFFSFNAFVGALLGLLAISTVLGSFYTVAAESEGVLLRFGKFVKIVDPGLHLSCRLAWTTWWCSQRAGS